MDVLYFDLSRAFDRQHIFEIIQKLFEIGIQGTMLKWITTYLSNRTFSIGFGSSFSSTFPTASDIPHGGVLSPSIYLIH